MKLPTQDKEIRERFVRMFDNATECFEATTSKRVVHERHELVVNEILKELERRGYHIDLQTLEERVLNRGWCTINEYQKLKVKRGK